MSSNIPSASTPLIPKPTFKIRPATLSDSAAMATAARAAYWDGDIDDFIAPNRNVYPEDHVRFYQQRIFTRALIPRNFSYVACPQTPSGEIGPPVAYVQFGRLGNDETAMKIERERDSWALWAMRVWFQKWFKIKNWWWPNRSEDSENLKTFFGWVDEDERKYWKSPTPSSNPSEFPAAVSSSEDPTITTIEEDRSIRYSIQSLVVSPSYQRFGLGRLLIEQCLNRAREEGVLVGLSASPQGEFLYRKVGFEMLGRFAPNTIGDPNKGGVFIWREGVKGKSNV